MPPATSYSDIEAGVCPEPECGEHGGSPKNAVRFEVDATGSGSSLSDTLEKAEVEIRQEHDPTDGFNTASATLPDGKKNVLYGSGGWLGPASNSAFEVWAKDPGIGISYLGIVTGGSVIKHAFLEEGLCSGVMCRPEVTEPVAYNSKMGDGRDGVEVVTENATPGGFGPVERATVKVDGTSPYNLKLAGLPANGELDERPYHLTAEATDGSGTTESSGVKSIELAVDGREVGGGKSGSCEPGPCVAAGEWTLDAEQLGAGEHLVEVIATDNAGSVATEVWSVVVHHPAPLSMGPGLVDPTTGAFSLSSTDVSIASGQGSLNLARSYDSRALTAGAEGVLGPEWQLSLAADEKLEVLPEGGGVQMVGAGGGVTMFASNGKGGFSPPRGDANLSLSAAKEGETVTEYVLSDPSAGGFTHFVQPEGTPAEDRASTAWYPHIAEGTLTSNNETYSFESVEGEAGKRIVRPHEALAPIPVGVTCPAVVGSEEASKVLKRGCRALTFNYATATTAKGEAPGEWGDYAGRLTRVYFTAWNTSAGAMRTVEVAHYLYDGKGRLRSEWDPRISPALETTYGYDPEGHVVAVKAPGQQPWLLRYGTWPGDPETGRLLSATRPPASASLAAEPAPVSIAAPSLSSTEATIGTTISVSSTGSWEHPTQAWAYQWLRCNASGANCVAIEGAVNSSYTPQAIDAGYTLVAKVTALNAAGTGSAQTAASKVLSLAGPSFTAAFGSAGSGDVQFAKPAAMAVDGEGHLWVADTANNRVQELKSNGEFVAAFGKEGSGEVQFKQPAGIAVGGEGEDVYVSDKGNDRIEVITPEGKYVRAFGSKGSGLGQLNEPKGIAVDSLGDVWVADAGNNRVEKFTATGLLMGTYGSVGTGNGQFKDPTGVAISGEDVYVTDSGNNRVQELTLQGAYVAQVGASGSGNGQFSNPTGIAADPTTHALYIEDTGNNRTQIFSPTGVFLAAFGSKGSEHGQFSEPQGVAFAASGNPDVLDTGNDRVEQYQHTYSTNDPAPAPPSVGENAVTTIDYQVPVSGSGAPYAMGETEEQAWAQEDNPVEATAIFPPSHVEGWPAKSSEGANISYFDEEGHLVNTASPSGGIATSEYNETGNVVRSLSVDNRINALKEGAKSAEIAGSLDTQSVYSSEGTRLLETLGPEHKIRLANGEEVQARNHVRYFYDEGAPTTGGPYDLVTRVIDGAQITGRREDAEVRVTETGYSGQQDLGWKLREPTSITMDPNNALSGVMTETFGALGAEHGKVNTPHGVAVAETGDVYVADTKNNRVDEFSAAGEYITQFGEKGTGSGELVEPAAIAVGKNGDVYVADTAQSKVKQYGPTGTYIRTITDSFEKEEPVVGISASGGAIYTVAEGIGDIVSVYSESGTIESWGCKESIANLKHPKGIVGDHETSSFFLSTAEGVVGVHMSGSAEGECETKKVASVGITAGEVESPQGLSIANKQLYVADAGNDRVDQFAVKAEYQLEYAAQYGSEGTGNGQLNIPGGVAIAPAGDMYIADTGNNRMERWNGEKTTGTSLTHTTLYDPTTGNVVETRSPGAGTGEPEGSGSYIYKQAFGALGSGHGQVNTPHGVAVAENGTVYLADTKNSRVDELSASGEYITQFGEKGTGSGELVEPAAIAIGKNGDVYVTDTAQSKVKQYSPTGTYIRTITDSLEAGEHVVGISASEGHIYTVAEGAADIISIYSESGELERWGCKESVANLKHPKGIVGDHETGSIFLSTEEGVVGVHMSGPAEGECETKKVASVGTIAGDVKSPQALSIANKQLYVADASNNRIDQFAVKAEYQLEYAAEYGSEGTGNGQLKNPDGVAIAPGGEMYIADTNNDRIQRWIPPGENAPPMQTIYYTAEAQNAYAECGEHPEWAGLICQTRPAYQPDTPSLPNLPVTTTAYNAYDEAVSTTETAGTSSAHQDHDLR